jgi:putative oxidoreductase
MKNITNYLNDNKSYALDIVRVTVGLMMLYHGLEVFDSSKIQEYSQWDSIKNSGSPLFMAYLGKGAEFLIGALLTLGFFTRLASLLMVCTMAFITFKIGNGQFWYGDQHPFMFVLLGVIYLFLGGGQLSIDNYFKK